MSTNRSQASYIVKHQGGFAYYIPRKFFKKMGADDSTDQIDIEKLNDSYQKLHVSVGYKDWERIEESFIYFLKKHKANPYFKVTQKNTDFGHSNIHPKNWRVYYGAQFTIYIPNDDVKINHTQTYIQLQRDIADFLEMNKVEPGVIPYTDAILNKYVSFRVDSEFDEETNEKITFESDDLGPGEYNPSKNKNCHHFTSIINEFALMNSETNRALQDKAIEDALSFRRKNQYKNKYLDRQNKKTITEPEINPRISQLLTVIIDQADLPINELKPALELFAKQTEKLSAEQIGLLFTKADLNNVQIEKSEEKIFKARNLILEYRIKHIENNALKNAFKLKHSMGAWLGLILLPVISIPFFIYHIINKSRELANLKNDVAILKTTPAEISDVKLYKTTFQEYKIKNRQLNDKKALYHHAHLPEESILKVNTTQTQPKLSKLIRKKFNIAIPATYTSNQSVTLYLPKEKVSRFEVCQSELSKDEYFRFYKQGR